MQRKRLEGRPAYPEKLFITSTDFRSLTSVGGKMIAVLCSTNWYQVLKNNIINFIVIFSNNSNVCDLFL